MERRLNTRVEDHFQVSYRVITPDEYDTLERVYRTTPSKEWGSPELRGTTPDPTVSHESQTAALLAELLKKVDLILETLNQNNKSPDAAGSPDYEKATCTVLSGGGMLLRGTCHHKGGQLLEMLVPLPSVSTTAVRLLATVVRDTERTGGSLETAVTFSTINDEDREQVIAYVFQRERHILAAHRAMSNPEG